MNIKNHLFALFLALLAALPATGQHSYFQTCRRYPDDDNLIEKVTMKFNEKSSRYTMRGDIDGLEMCIEVMSDLNSYNLPLTAADIENQKGILNYYRNRNTEALKNYLYAFDLFNSYGFTEGINTLFNNIAIIFARVEDYESTLKYLAKALEYTDRNDYSSYSLLELNIAETEILLGNYTASLEIAERLYDEYKPGEANFELISVSGVIIDNYNKIGDYEKAMEWIQMTPDSLLEGAGYMDLISYCPKAMETYFNTNQFNIVLEAGKNVYPPPDPAFLPELYEVIDLLSKSSIETGRYTMAIEYEKILRDIEFSRTSVSREDLVTLLMTDYAFNIDNLARQNIEKELDINNERDRALKKFIIEFLVVIIIVSILTSVLVRSRKTRKITREKLAEENNKLALVNREISSTNKLLEKENNLLDTLISVFAHDLINPFQAILGFSKLMISDFKNIDEENIIEYTGLLSDTSFQLNQLLINLKNMAVLQEENRHLESSVFKVDPIIYDIINLFTPAAKKKDIEFRYNGKDSLQGFMNMKIFQSVIRNVISNAVKFSHSKGFIDIETSNLEGKTVISVRDYGTGMPEDIKQKLLSGDYLKSSPGTLKEKGSGLGLTICIELLERYSGKIEIESNEGFGTLIKVIIPSKK